MWVSFDVYLPNLGKEVTCEAHLCYFYECDRVIIHTDEKILDYTDLIGDDIQIVDELINQKLEDL